MSVALQLIKNEQALPALFIDKDLHLNKLVAATVAAVNLWVKIQDGSDKNPFELCFRKLMDDFGGTLFSQRPLEAVYQLNYDENTAASTLKIERFAYWNVYLQCKAFGDVYGFVQYNKLAIEPILPFKFYNFDNTTNADGTYVNPKQYNIVLEPDEADKAITARLEKEKESKPEEADNSQPSKDI